MAELEAATAVVSSGEQLAADSAALDAWLVELRACARSEDARAALRASMPSLAPPLLRALAAAAPRPQQETAVAAVANLLVGGGPEGLQAMLASGVLGQLFMLCHVVQGSDTGKLGPILAIALNNLAQQLPEPPAASAAADGAAGEASAVVCQELAAAGIAPACEALALQAGGTAGVSATSAAESLCDRSAVLRSALTGMITAATAAADGEEDAEPSAQAEGQHAAERIVAAIPAPGALAWTLLLLGSGRSRGVQGVASLDTVQRLLAAGLGEKLLDLAFTKQEQGQEAEESVAGDAVLALLAMARFGLSAAGVPGADADMAARVEALHALGATRRSIDALRDTVPESGAWDASRGVARGVLGAAQLLAALLAALPSIVADEELREAAAAAIAVADAVTSTMDTLVQQLRDAHAAPEPLLPADEAAMRQRILPLAELRLEALKVINQVASEPRASLITIAASGSPSCSAASLSARVVIGSLNFDLEAGRLALNVLRNLALDQSGHEQLLEQLPEPLGSLVLRVLRGSRDQATVTLAGAALRLVLRNPDAAVGRQALDAGLAADLAALDVRAMHPVAHVELARAMAHLLREDGAHPLPWPAAAASAGAAGGPGDKALGLASFLLQSEDLQLHDEALRAMAAAPGGMLRAAKAWRLQIRQQGKTEVQTRTLPARLHFLAKHYATQRGARSEQEATAAAGVAALAKRVLAKMDEAPAASSS